MQRQVHRAEMQIATSPAGGNQLLNEERLDFVYWDRLEVAAGQTAALRFFGQARGGAVGIRDTNMEIANSFRSLDFYVRGIYVRWQEDTTIADAVGIVSQAVLGFRYGNARATKFESPLFMLGGGGMSIGNQVGTQNGSPNQLIGGFRFSRNAGVLIPKETPFNIDMEFEAATTNVSGVNMDVVLIGRKVQKISG